jgi:hypothetical protein
MRQLMFHEASQSSGQRIFRNAGLRELDESWRIKADAKDPGEFAVLVGRLAPAKGNAEDVTAGPATATRLWLGAMPDGAATRPKLEGSLRQETYFRVYLPVTPRK